MAEPAPATQNVPVTTDGGSGEPAARSLPGLGFLEHFSDISVLRQVGLLVGLAASIAIGFGVVLWSRQPDYRPLLTSLTGMDVQQVMDALGAADIDYKVEPNSGALLVQSEDLGRARLKLASAGLAPADANVGFEILDQDQGLGTSQFMEATRYRRGLEGELARTISSLNNVKAARVHLAIPKSSVFVRDERKPSASVLVEVYPGRALEPSQVMAIVNLVATSVPELDKSQVTVVDQQGHLLSDQQELSALTMAGRQFDYTRRVESLLTQRVHNILQPVLGMGRYKAEVSADVDFNAVESTSETYSPDRPALRSEQSVTERRQIGSTQGGVPGSLSNQPPAAAAAPEVAGAAGSAGPVQPGQPLLDANGVQIADAETGQPRLAPYPEDLREQQVRNYEIDRSISHVRQQQGQVRRLSVAVVVDDQVRTGAEGEVLRTPWTADDLARFTRLVQDAVGYDPTRGDSVSVINTAFAADQGDEMFDVPFYAQPWFWDVVKQAMGLVFILILVFGVLKPALRSLSGHSDGAAKGGADAVGEADDGLGGRLEDDLDADRVSLSGSPAPILLPGPSEGYDAQLTAIRNLVAEDPGRVALVVKEWINADD